MLRGIVLVLLVARPGRGDLAFLQKLEQSGGDIVELFHGETTFKILAEWDRDFRPVVVIIAVGVVARGRAGTVGGVDDRGCLGPFVNSDGRGVVMWFGDEGTVLLRFFLAFGCPQPRKPADERREG